MKTTLNSLAYLASGGLSSDPRPQRPLALAAVAGQLLSGARQLAPPPFLSSKRKEGKGPSLGSFPENHLPKNVTHIGKDSNTSQDSAKAKVGAASLAVVLVLKYNEENFFLKENCNSCGQYFY